MRYRQAARDVFSITPQSTMLLATPLYSNTTLMPMLMGLVHGGRVALMPKFDADAKGMATRVSSGKVLNSFAKRIPWLLGGSADLGESNLTHWAGSRVIRTDAPAGNYIHYGVREFAMTAIMNGIALHGGFIPYGGTFLVFSDYARNAVRMAALIGVPVVLVYTHDSIGLGEDGPTHQAVEQAASLAGEFYYHVTQFSLGPFVDQIGRFPSTAADG
jgi:transketolase